ncbi:MAG: ABC transporter ATP-binding protein [Nannocystales bacterium]
MAESATETVDKMPVGSRVRRLLGYAWPYRVRLLVALVCLMIGSGLGLLYPAYFGDVIDAAFKDKDVTALSQHSLTLVAIFAIQAVFVFFRHYMVSWVGERVVADLRVQLYRHLVTLSQTYFHEKRTGELLSRLAEDVGKVHGTVSSDVSMAARNALTLVGGISILLYTNLQLTLVMLAVVPPLAIATVFFGRKIRLLARKAQDELAQANAELGEGIAGIETVQAFTREDFEVERYGQSVARSFELFIKRVLAGAWFMSLSSFLAFSAIAGIFFLGGRMVATDAISPGDLTEFMLYTMMVAGSVGAVAGIWARLQAALGASARLFEILDTQSDLVESETPTSLEKIEGHVLFDEVSFTYGDRDAAVLEGVSLQIEPGETCALVGSSGSGKTTIARLLQRMYDPTQGAVTLDGINVRDVALEELRGLMAVVSQEPILFSGTIRDNIRYGDLTASDADIERAASMANADGFIREFPEGYDTKVGERGVQLSGGQRQRVSIARAILRDPKVLILDEATSALDAMSEGLVQEALEKLQAGRTTLVIAHRLSTVRDADRIVVLDRGRIVEAGTHSALMENKGAYSELVARQSDAAA